MNDELGLRDQAKESATLASIIKQSQSPTSAFAAHSQKAFDDLSPEGQCQPILTLSVPLQQMIQYLTSSKRQETLPQAAASQ